MSAQTSYQRLQNIAYAGLIFGLEPREVTSGTVQGANVAPGLVVGRGSEDDTVVIGGSSFYGIAVRALDVEGDSDAVLEYTEGDVAAILRSGKVYAQCLSGCVPGDVVQFFTQAGADAAPGVVISGSLGAGAPLQANLAAGVVAVIPGATWESTTEAGGIGLLRILPTSAPVFS